MNAICFEIKAPFGTFKDPRTTRGYFSFPVPPKTALIGLLGGIFGVPHNVCYQKDHFLSKANISLQIINPPLFFSCRTNETQTKEVQSVQGMKIGYPSNKLDRGFSSPQTSMYLMNIWYRIFVNMEKTHQDELFSRLKNHEYVYPPFLGRANMLAEIEFEGEIELQTPDLKQSFYDLISIFDTEAVKDIEGATVIIPKIPNSYEVHEKESKIGKDKYLSLQVQTQSFINIGYGKDVSTKFLKIRPTEIGLNRLFQIKSSTSLNISAELKNKHIIFLPN